MFLKRIGLTIAFAAVGLAGCVTSRGGSKKLLAGLTAGRGLFLVPAETVRLLQIISTENSPVRRAGALRLLLGGVSAATKDVAVKVANEFAAACLTPLLAGKRNKQGESLLEECLPGIAQIDRDLADRILGQLSPSRSGRALRPVEALSNVPLAQIFSWPHFGAAA
jgi:hypothetical protein